MGGSIQKPSWRFLNTIFHSMAVVRTKRWIKLDKAITDTAYALLREKECDFSVNRICETVHISLTTFHRHYKYLNDLLIKIKIEQIDIIKDLYSGRIKRDDKFFIPFLNYVKNNQELFCNTFSLYADDSEFHVTYPLKDRHSAPLFERQSDDYMLQKLYYHTYYNAALISCVLLWLKRGCVETVEEVSKMLYDCSKPELFSMFDKKYLKRNNTEQKKNN